MARQHAAPILMATAERSASALTPLGLAGGADAVSEAAIQQLVHDNPSCLPIAEVDPLFLNPIPICMELNTAAGPIDNFMVTASGLPVLVECKLWRNPEGRREVIGQILDYAKELGRWTSSDLQREVARRLKRQGNAVLDMVREAGHEVDEIQFNDALTFNLRRGRFLLLIVGDGIREGVETISEYLQAHAGLHFTLGLIELPIYVLPSGDRLAVPRVLARTQLITRTVVSAPEGAVVLDEGAQESPPDEKLDPASAARVRFLSSVVNGLFLDDPDQQPPKVTPKGYCYIYLPAPASSCWIEIISRPGSAGIKVTSNANSIGEQALQIVARDWEEVSDALGGQARLRFSKETKPVIEELRPFDAEEEAQAIEWLRGRVNDFVNVLRPAIRSAVQEII